MLEIAADEHERRPWFRHLFADERVRCGVLDRLDLLREIVVILFEQANDCAGALMNRSQVIIAKRFRLGVAALGAWSHQDRPDLHGELVVVFR